MAKKPKKQHHHIILAHRKTICNQGVCALPSEFKQRRIERKLKIRDSRSHWSNTNNLISPKAFFNMRNRNPPHSSVAEKSAQEDKESFYQERNRSTTQKPGVGKWAFHNGDNAGFLAQETAARAQSDPWLCPQQRVMTTDMSSTLCATETLSVLPALSCWPSRVSLKMLELQISPPEPESVLTIRAWGNHDPLTNPPLKGVWC